MEASRVVGRSRWYRRGETISRGIKAGPQGAAFFMRLGRRLACLFATGYLEPTMGATLKRGVLEGE